MASRPQQNRTKAGAHAIGHKGASATGAGGTTTTKQAPAKRVQKPAAVEIDASACVTLAHALRGRRVECTVVGDPLSGHRRDKRVRGKLTGANATVTIIDGICWWSANVKDLKEMKK